MERGAMREGSGSQATPAVRFCDRITERIRSGVWAGMQPPDPHTLRRSLVWRSLCAPLRDGPSPRITPSLCRIRRGLWPRPPQRSIQARKGTPQGEGWSCGVRIMITRGRTAFFLVSTRLPAVIVCLIPAGLPFAPHHPPRPCASLGYKSGTPGPSEILSTRGGVQG